MLRLLHRRSVAAAGLAKMEHVNAGEESAPFSA
jgi:hypothetical protein